MMTIGGIELDNDLVWEDEFQFNEGTGSAERTIYGNLLVQTFKITGGRPLTLVGDQSNGWQKRSTVLALKALADTDPGAVHIVELPSGTTYYAMFRNEEAPVVEFKPITLVTEPDADFWYYGVIRMRII